MEEVLKSEISKIKELVEMKKDLISDEMAFNFLILQYFCYNSKNFHAMTANAFIEDRMRAKEAGMDEHIAKPVDRKLLVKVINELVKHNQREQL